MAYISKTYTINNTEFRILHQTDNKEIWLQALPNYHTLGYFSTEPLHNGEESMADFVKRLKVWLNDLITEWFTTPVEDPVAEDPVAIPPSSLEVQIDELIVNLLIVDDRFV